MTIKKLILLSAGTLTFALSANAASLVISYDSFTSTAQAGTEGNNTMQSSNGYEPSFSDGTATFDGSGNGDVLFIMPAKGTSLSIGKDSGLSVTMAISNLSFGSGDGTIFSINQSGGAWGLDIKNDSSNTFTGHWGGNQNSAGYDASKTVPTGEFVLTVTQSGTNTSLYIDGTLFHTFTGLGTSVNSPTVSQFNIGNSNKGSDGVNMTLSKLYIHNGAMNAEEVQAFYNNTVIPEPSAFGLLVGLGALALVASRRRRSREAA